MSSTRPFLLSLYFLVFVRHAHGLSFIIRPNGGNSSLDNDAPAPTFDLTSPLDKSIRMNSPMFTHGGSTTFDVIAPLLVIFDDSACDIATYSKHPVKGSAFSFSG